MLGWNCALMKFGGASCCVFAVVHAIFVPWSIE